MDSLDLNHINVRRLQEWSYLFPVKLLFSTILGPETANLFSGMVNLPLVNLEKIGERSGTQITF